MLLAHLWDWLEAAVFPLPSTAGDRPLFNFYRDEDPRLDLPGAAAARRANLRRWLEQFTVAPRWLAVGEAPGWRGARFSGIPFVSEALLAGGALGVCGPPTGRAARPYAEASATLFWDALAGQPAAAGGVLAWNSLPFHPHLPAQPCSNRRPALAEIEAHRSLLLALVDLVRPAGVIAIGRCAELALERAGIPAQSVRHPSHGGAREFQRQIKQALAIPADRL